VTSPGAKDGPHWILVERLDGQRGFAGRVDIYDLTGGTRMLITQRPSEEWRLVAYLGGN
jgi:hypothetical protein